MTELEEARAAAGVHAEATHEVHVRLAETERELVRAFACVCVCVYAGCVLCVVCVWAVFFVLCVGV